MNESHHPFHLNGIFRFCGYFFGFAAILFLALIWRIPAESRYGFLGGIGFVLIVAALLFHLGRSEIRLTETSFVLMLFTKKVVPYMDIKKLSLIEKEIRPGSITSPVKILALIIEYGESKKIEVNVHFYGNPGEILKTLEQKTGKKFEMTEAAKNRLQSLKIKL